MKVSRVEKQTLAFKGREVPVLIHFENRNNSRVAIGKRGVSIRLPRYLSKYERSKQITSLKSWAEKKLTQKPDLLWKPKRKRYFTGQIVTARGKDHYLVFAKTDSRTSKASLEGNVVYLHISVNLDKEERQKTIATLVSRCLANKYYDEMYNRLLYWNKLYFGKRINGFRLKYTHSVWGSCSGKGNINLSTRLLLAPKGVMDYVMVHELAHLVQANHSKKFWDIVESIMPDYQKKVDWLRENSQHCDF